VRQGLQERHGLLDDGESCHEIVSDEHADLVTVHVQRHRHIGGVAVQLVQPRVSRGIGPRAVVARLPLTQRYGQRRAPVALQSDGTQPIV